jgi:transaldolase
VTGEYASAQKVLDDLEALGISYDDVIETLEREAVEKFSVSWNELLTSVTEQLDAAREAAANAGPAATAGGAR